MLISIFMDSTITSGSPAATCRRLALALSRRCRQDVSPPRGHWAGSSPRCRAAASNTVASVAISAWPAARQRSRSASKAACCFCLKSAIDAGVREQKLVVLPQTELRLLDFELESSEQKVLPELQQLRLALRDRNGSDRRSAAATACHRGNPPFAARGSTSAPCGRRTGSRPGLPSHIRIDTRRRCRPHSPASRFAPGCTWW